MLSNYLLIAWRNLLSQRLFSAINILGLAIGLASCILIALFVRYELSYDMQFTNADRIARVVRHFNTMNLSLAAVAPPFAGLIKEDFDQVEDVTRVNTMNLPLSVEDRPFSDLIIGVADPNIFGFFDLQFLRGDAAALGEPFSVVLTQSAAQNMFGNKDPMGQPVTLMGQIDMKVTGVIADLPQNTHLEFDMLGSIETFFMVQPGERESFGSNNYYTYLQLAPGTDLETLEGQLPGFLDKHLGEDAHVWNALELQPLTSIHLNSSLDGEQKANGSIAIVRTFSAIAIVILLIACINFMNLTTARSTQRAKEVGMRKVAGATRGQLIAQFLGESILLTTAAMVIALAIVELTLPWFAAFVERDLTFRYLSSPGDLAVIVGGVVLVGVVAGSYPAFHLSSFRPAQVLKGNAVQGKGSANLRKGLVVFQFAISITLMIATAVVLWQLRYAQTRDLGYERAHNLVVSLPFQMDGSTYDQFPPFRDALVASPAIDSVVISSRVPTGQLLDGNGYQLASPRTPEQEEGTVLRDVRVGFGFFEHYGVRIVAGRPLSPEFGDQLFRIPQNVADDAEPLRGQAMVSVTGARQMGFQNPNDIVGELLLSGAPDGFHVKLEIVGVVDDFHFASLHDALRPVLYSGSQNFVSQVSVRARPGELQEAYDHVLSTWKRQFPGQAQNISFLDDRFEAMYRQEKRQAKVFGIFAGLAIFVASLGLFGLASFTTERRTKEIGIRKVMGASVKDIVLLLTREFSVLVLIANLVAWPVAWYFMSDWLTRFAYHVDLSPALFVGAALVAFVIAWVTVATLAGRSALARPIRALRYE